MGWDVYGNHNSVLSYCPVPPWVPSQPHSLTISLEYLSGAFLVGQAYWRWSLPGSVHLKYLSISFLFLLETSFESTELSVTAFSSWALRMPLLPCGLCGFQCEAASQSPCGFRVYRVHSPCRFQESLPADTMPIICLSLGHSQLLLLGVCMCAFILQQTWKTVSSLFLQLLSSPSPPLSLHSCRLYNNVG